MFMRGVLQRSVLALTRSVASSSMEASRAEHYPLARKLWVGSRKEALFALYNPFVVSLVSGKLGLQSFKRFIAQDAFFLKAFAHTYGVAMQYTEDEAAKLSISRLQESAHQELKLHSSLAKTWNIDMEELGTPNAATLKYTTFLTDVASRKIYDEMPRKLAAFTIGAMVPCMRLYAFLGQEASKMVGVDAEHPYKDWISTYASSDFEDSAAQVEEVLERLSTGLETGDFPKLQDLYRRAMMLELDFFSANAKSGEASSVPLLKSATVGQRRMVLVTDFDSTCTVSDSCPILAQLAMRNDKEVETRWTRLSQKYFDDYKRLLERVVGSRKYGAAFDYTEVEAALEVLSEFEKQGNSSVIISKVLCGIKLDDIKGAARELPLQTGCAEFFQRLRKEEVSVDCHILSVCWSQTFIQAALAKEDIATVFSIHSNELGNDGSQTDGSLIRRVETPVDKVRVLLQSIVGDKQRSDEFVIYVGDSLTDLLCLLQADVGIVVGASSSLGIAAEAFGVRIVPLSRCVVEKEKSELARWKTGDGVLYSASGWNEIEAFLLGRPSTNS